MPRFALPWILPLAVALACGDSSDPAASAAKSAAPAPTPTPAPSPAPAPAEPGVRADGSIVSAVDWFHGSLDEALAAAKRDDKLVFVDVGAYWCPPCHRLDEETFVDAAVGEALGTRYVAVHIDAEKGEGPELVDRYKVQAYPTLLVLEASGVEKGRIVDFLAPTDLLATLGDIEAGGNVLADLQAAVDDDPDDPKARYALGHAEALAADVDAAEKNFRVVELADPKNELGLAAKVAYDRAMFVTYKVRKDLDGAIAAYRQLQTRYPDSKEATRAYRQLGRILCEQGKPKEALVELDAMLATDPEDVGLHSTYGWFSFREKCEPARGLEVVEAGLKLEPDSADLHYLRAELRQLTGDLPGALAAMEAAAKAEPDSAFYKRQVRMLRDEVGGK